MELIRVCHLPKLSIFSQEIIAQPWHHGVMRDDLVFVDLDHLVNLGVGGFHEIGKVSIVTSKEELLLFTFQVQGIERKVFQGIPSIFDDS